MARTENTAFLIVDDVWKYYPDNSNSKLWKKRLHPVLKGVSFSVAKGKILGLLGESGSGKSTLARQILGLERPEKGTILIEGQPLAEWRKSHPGRVSAVFQDYTTSINPAFTVGEAIAEGFKAIPGAATNRDGIIAIMGRAGLAPELIGQLPRQLSGGQAQRVCIARAMASNPDFIVFDEAVSALDAPVQAQIARLLKELHCNATYLFITHDIQIAALLCDELVVLHHGVVTDRFDVGEIDSTTSPYLRKLLASTVIFRSSLGC